MKRTFKYIFPLMLASLVTVACEENERIEYTGDGYDDAYYAEQAGISSSDASFTGTSDGGSIWFKSGGGTITVSVSCGTSWVVENNAADIFTTSVTSTTLDITAGQNTAMEELTGTIEFKTAVQRITFATLTVTQNAYGSIEITADSDEWDIPAVGDLTTEIGVSATADWTAEPADRWLSAEKTNVGVRLTAEENENPIARSSRVTLICTDGVTTEYEYITVNQGARAYINLSSAVISFGMDESSASVGVESNFDWEYSYDTSNGWFTVAKDSDGLIISAGSNADGDRREGVVTISAGDGAENVVEVELSVSQAGLSDMILTYSITSPTTQLPLSGTVDCTVDWGDGSELEAVTSEFPSHTYDETGEYDITIIGTVTALNSESLSTSTKVLPITAVKQWGKTGLTSMHGAFSVCQKLESLPEQTNGALADVTDFYYAFFNCTSLTEIPADLFGGCSKATNFEYVFYDCESLKAVPAGLFDDCTKAETFRCAFYYCINITELPSGLFAKCEDVTDFSFVIHSCMSLKSFPEGGIFGNHPKLETLNAAIYDCTSLTEVPEDLFSGCAPGTDVSHVFHGCTGLKTVPEGIFDVFTETDGFYCSFSGCSGLETLPEGLFAKCVNVETFFQTFTSCESLKEIPEGLFANNTKVTDFQSTFQRCPSLTQIPENLFANCVAAENFAFTFYNDTSLKEIPENLFASCPKVTSFYGTFQSCSELTEIPEKLFANCPEVENFSYCFFSCTGLTFIPAGLFSNNLKVTNFTSLFRRSRATDVLTGESPYDLVDGVKVHLYERSNYPSIYTRPTSYGDCFLNCTGLSDYSSIPSGWKS